MSNIKGSTADLERIKQLEKERMGRAEDLERRKAEMQKELASTSGGIETKFATNDSALESQFKSATVGLVSAEDYKRQRMILSDKEAAAKSADAADAAAAAEAAKARRAAQRKRDAAVLSFGGDDDGDSFDVPAPRPKKRTTAASTDPSAPAADPAAAVAKSKDPTVETSFLPDKARDAEEAAMRARLEQEWADKLQAERKEVIEVVFSYWDGSGHRNVVRVTKGTTIEQFLSKCRALLADRFPELRVLGAESMVYVKEDLIIPHHYSFHDLIVTRARGKSGPLFHFGVHEDVRLAADARVEKDESHAGKVMTRAWYDRNKHIFPASRWEVYDPARKMEGYTIAGKEVR